MPRGRVPIPLEDRIWQRVTKTATCWLWTGARNSDGYGVVYVDGRRDTAHRAAWKMRHGAIPDGLCVLHTCDTPLCLRDEHLYLGTQAQNSRDRVERVRQARGERHGRSKLTEDDVRIIRATPIVRGTLSALARKYGVDIKTLRDILDRKHWQHVA